MLEPLGEDAQPRPVPEHDLDEIGSPAPEQDVMAADGIAPQHALHERGEPIDAFSCVRIAERQMNLHAERLSVMTAGPPRLARWRHDRRLRVSHLTKVMT